MSVIGQDTPGSAGIAGSSAAPPAPVLVAGPETTTSSWALIGRFLKDWCWPRRWQIAVVLLVTAALSAVTGAYPLIIKVSFDSLQGGSADMLPLVLGAVVVITATRSVLLYLQMILSSRFIIRQATDIRTAAFEKLMSLDFARLVGESPGHHVSRLTTEIGFIEGASQAALSTAVRDVLSVFVLVATMFYLDWVMSTVVLLVYPIAFWPILAVSERLRKVAKRTQAEIGGMTSLLTEKFGAIRLIKAFRLERYAGTRAADRFEQVFALRLKAVRNKAKIDPMLEALGGVAVAGVIALAHWRISSGQSTVGDFMGFVSALLMAAQPIRGLGNLSARLQEGLAAVEKLYVLMDERPRIVERAGAAALRIERADITFNGASFAYPGRLDMPAVREFTLSIAGGSTVAVVGRSGAGKSTLINLVPRLFDVTGGRILIDGQDIRDVTIASLRDAVAIVSQDITLFDDTIRANIALGRLEATDEQIVAAARSAAADTFIRAQPQGYDTRIGDAGARLSGGQRQRIALARAFLKDAPILLLDEATSALDTESEALVQSALAEFARNRTTLIIAHRLSTVQNADLICVMDDGRLAERGTHAELVAAGGIYADLCRTQLLQHERPMDA